jgi:hypothetical protein
LGGLSLGLVELGDAAAVGRLGLGGLLPAQPGDLLHQRHVYQHSPPRHVPACGDEADQAIHPASQPKHRKTSGDEGSVLRRMRVRTKVTARRGRKRKTTASSNATARPPAMAPAAARFRPCGERDR